MKDIRLHRAIIAVFLQLGCIGMNGSQATLVEHNWLTNDQSDAEVVKGHEELIVISVGRQVVEVRYGDSRVPEMFTAFLFSRLPTARITATLAVTDLAASRLRDLSALGCENIRAALGKAHAVWVRDSYSFTTAQGQRCSFRFLEDASGKPLYAVVTKFNISIMRYNETP
jgi:hypothetical protein